MGLVDPFLVAQHGAALVPLCVVAARGRDCGLDASYRYCGIGEGCFAA